MTLFSNLDFTHIGGEWIRDIKKNLLSEKWKVKNINGKPAISYRVNDNEFSSNRYENNKYAYCNLVHIAISENRMLTIRLYCTADSSFVEKLCDEFSQRILNSWELCPALNDSVEHLSGDGHKDKYASEDKHGEGDRAISQHIFEPFSYCLPDEEAFKIILRNNSKNKIEWYLFECSDFFDDWFNQQYKYIEKEYIQKIREYVNQSVLSLQQKVSVKKEEA